MAIAAEKKARTSRAEYGSDVIVDMLRELGIEYVALNPGASYRGLHDSLVNYGDSSSPETILCNHEGIAVAIAHGYSKAAGKPMATMRGAATAAGVPNPAAPSMTDPNSQAMITT